MLFCGRKFRPQIIRLNVGLCLERFPEKFCFQLNSNEVESVKSQIATSRGTGFFAGQNGGGREIHHFGASLKDLGKKTFFCSKEDFTLEEVLKETQKD